MSGGLDWLEEGGTGSFRGMSCSLILLSWAGEGLFSYGISSYHARFCVIRRASVLDNRGDWRLAAITVNVGRYVGGENSG